jgi:hypothetical protein
MYDTEALYHTEAHLNLPSFVLGCCEERDSFWGGVFRINKLEFEPEFLGCVKLVVVVATLAGVAAYNCCLKDVPLKKMFFWTTIFRTLLGLMQVKFHF